MDKRTLSVTMTGEIFHPARVYYRVHNRIKLVAALRRLDCMAFDGDRQRWVWLYTGRAKKLAFKKPYAVIAREQARPIVIGSFHVRDQGESWLDLRSFDRVIEAIPFFAHHIPRKVAEVTDVAVVNRCFELGTEREFDVYFHPDRVSVPDPAATLEALKRAAEQAHAADEDALAAVHRVLSAETDEALPEVERLPSHFYEDGISPLAMTLRFREIAAFEHWNGNTQFGVVDAIDRVLGKL